MVLCGLYTNFIDCCGVFVLFPATTSATAGTDFTALANVVGSAVSFADTVATANCIVTITNDDENEPDEIITLTLDITLGGGTVGAQGTHDVTILRDPAECEYSGIGYGCLPTVAEDLSFVKSPKWLITKL